MIYKIKTHLAISIRLSIMGNLSTF